MLRLITWAALFLASSGCGLKQNRSVDFPNRSGSAEVRASIHPIHRMHESGSTGPATTPSWVVLVDCLATPPTHGGPPCVSPQNQPLFRKIINEAKLSGSDSLIIRQAGVTLFEAYSGGTPKVQSVQSVTKSVSALAVMKLIEAGSIASLDAPMSTWIPIWAADPQKSKITLRMIMDQTSGIPDTDTFPAFFSSDDYVVAAEGVPLIGPPGHQFDYTTIGVTLLAPVIAQASGLSVSTFIHKFLFSPLGISDEVWAKDAAGHEETGGGLYLSPGDMLKIGQLILGQGSFDGAPILTSDAVHTLTTQSQNFFPYGLLWWLDAPSSGSTPSALEVSSAYGWGGQYITVFPLKQLIAVRTKDPSEINVVDPSQSALQGFYDFRGLVSDWR